MNSHEEEKQAVAGSNSTAEGLRVVLPAQGESGAVPGTWEDGSATEQTKQGHERPTSAEIMQRRQITKLLFLLNGQEGTKCADIFLYQRCALQDFYTLSSEQLDGFNLPDELVFKILRWQGVPCLLNSPKMVQLTRRYYACVFLSF